MSWDCIEKVWVFINTKGPNVLYLYFKEDKVVVPFDENRFDQKIIKIRFAYVSQKIQEIEDFISHFKKVE